MQPFEEQECYRIFDNEQERYLTGLYHSESGAKGYVSRYCGEWQNRVKYADQSRFVVRKFVLVEAERLQELEKDSDWLESLNAAGVDNWSGIDYAQELHEEAGDER